MAHGFGDRAVFVVRNMIREAGATRMRGMPRAEDICRAVGVTPSSTRESDHDLVRAEVWRHLRMAD